MLRSIIDRLYKRTRATSDGLDPRLPPATIIYFLGSKVAQRARAIFRGQPRGFVSTRVRLRGRRLLTVGTNVSIGHGVLIDAVSETGVTLGSRTTIDDFSIIRASGVLRNLGVGIEVGSNTSIGAFNFIHGGGGVSIGSNCLLGPNVALFSENHIFDDPTRSIRSQGERRASVRIGDDVWVGAGSTILSGVSVGTGAVIAAGSVVTKDVQPWTVVGGVPAKHIRGRDE